jgi:hypothetical protein
VFDATTEAGRRAEKWCPVHVGNLIDSICRAAGRSGVDDSVEVWGSVSSSNSAA